MLIIIFSKFIPYVMYFLHVYEYIVTDTYTTYLSYIHTDNYIYYISTSTSSENRFYFLILL